MAMLFVLIYIAASTAFAQILPLPVLQDLTNSNIKRRILYDAIQAAAVIPFAVTYFRDTAFRKIKISSKWIPWGLIGVCAILVTIILPERVYAFWFYLIIVGCGEEFAHGYSHFMVLGGTITGILSELGGGIVGALIFSAIYEKSNSIGWPILIHACLDFTGYLV